MSENNLWKSLKGPFPEPLGEGEFQHRFEEVEQQTQNASDSLSMFESSFSFENMEHSLLSFAGLFKSLDECAKHPTDIDRLLKNKVLIDDLASLLEQLEEYNLLDVFRHSIPVDEKNPVEGKKKLALASLVELGILQVKFFIGLAKKEQHE